MFFLYTIERPSDLALSLPSHVRWVTNLLYYTSFTARDKGGIHYLVDPRGASLTPISDTLWSLHSACSLDGPGVYQLLPSLPTAGTYSWELFACAENDPPSPHFVFTLGQADL